MSYSNFLHPAFLRNRFFYSRSYYENLKPVNGKFFKVIKKDRSNLSYGRTKNYVKS